MAPRAAGTGDDGGDAPRKRHFNGRVQVATVAHGGGVDVDRTVVVGKDAIQRKDHLVLSAVRAPPSRYDHARAPAVAPLRPYGDRAVAVAAGVEANDAPVDQHLQRGHGGHG